MGWSRTLTHLCESKTLHVNKLVFRAVDPDRIPQRSAEAAEGDRHHVPVLEPQPVLEAEHLRAEEMHVHVAGPPVLGVLEMVMLEVRQRVTHPLLPAGERAGPEGFAGAIDRGDARDVG